MQKELCTAKFAGLCIEKFSRGDWEELEEGELKGEKRNLLRTPL